MAAQLRAEDILRDFVLINVIKASWELRLPHILNETGCEGLSLAEIARRLQHSKPSGHHDQVACEQALRRILRFLASHYLIRCGFDEHNNETYSLPPPPAAGADGEGLNEDLSPWPSLAACAALLLDPHSISIWQKLPETVVHGSVSGPTFYNIIDSDVAFRQVFDAAMISLSSAFIYSFCTTNLYDMDPYRKASTFVDVGGGSGHFAAAIARRHPHLTRVINFDLPHVVAAAPNHSGVEHAQGDMFQFIPSADIILMKSVLHNWSDEDCIRILQNCSKSLIGCKKLVIIDVVLEDTIIAKTHISATRDKLALDTAMLAVFATTKGKERTKNEWGIILREAKFANYNFLQLEESRSQYSIIEATID